MNRKVCQVCKKPLIAMQGHYLHIEKPCSGLVDCISIVATIDDEFLQKKFVEMYGKPERDDYDTVTMLEEESERLAEALAASDKKLKIPLIRFIAWFLNYIVKK